MIGVRAAAGTSVVDFHARLLRRPGEPAALLAVMDSAGIDRAVVSAGGLIDLDQLSTQVNFGGRTEARADNAWVRRQCETSGGRLLPFFFADPYRDVDAYRAGAASFRGLEISPAVHGFRLNHPGVLALVDIAESMGHPVYVVCLGRVGTRAGDLVTLARLFARTTFVFGHCGHTGLDASGLAQIALCPNIVAETSGCYLATARLALCRLGPDRVVFGTEYPLQHPRIELAKFAALDVATADLRQVMSGNAGRLLGEEST